jgi:hypothetical protein
MSKNAYVTIHFGSNPVYLELELYFFIMLRKYTKNDIIYLYSTTDTPESFVEAVRPFVTDVIPYDDRGITYDTKFKSGYTNFNTLRTCNFIFAYTLEKYKKICIIESDMVIMNNIDSIFELNAPAVLSYYISNPNPENEKIIHNKKLNTNVKINNNPREVITNCNKKGRLNGGVMLIEPSMRLFEMYIEKIRDIIGNTCKYPNETLFEYVNNSYYNLPVRYNLSHHHTKPYFVKGYELNKNDILVFHFNETDYKHIDTIKNPVDEKGQNWLDIYKSTTDPKYIIKKIPILHYKKIVYDENHRQIEDIISSLSKKKEPVPMQVEVPTQVEVPMQESMSMQVTQENPVIKKWTDRIDVLIGRINAIETEKDLLIFDTKYIQPILEINANKKMDIIIKDKIKNLLDVYSNKLKEIHETPKKTSSEKKASSEKLKKASSEKKASENKKKRCPNGFTRNKKTGNCDPKITTKKRCPNGFTRNKKTGNCDPKK